MAVEPTNTADGQRIHISINLNGLKPTNTADGFLGVAVVAVGRR